MAINWRGFHKVATKTIKRLGSKINADNIKVLGRKVGNTIRDVAGYVAPIADGIGSVAAMAGHPEIASAAATASSIAHRLK